MSDFKPSLHPVLRLPTQAQARLLGAEKTRELLLQREKLIQLEKNDPIRNGFEPPIWKLVDEQLDQVKEVLILGGNRASKSDYAAKRVMEKLMSKPNIRAWCFQTSEQNSVEMQQSVLWKYLPLEWRGAKKNVVTNISYTQKNGFSENNFVCPNGSQCWFRNYMQDIRTIEGGEVDVIWADELVPQNWLQTMRYRLVTRGGILIVTFTPIDGYNATVKEYLAGAKTLQDAPAPLLGDEKVKVPRVQQPVRKGARIIYFHTSDNPYGGYENLKKTLEGGERKIILCRAYGVPTKAIANRFPKFSDSVHVIPLSRLPKEGTSYLVVDPCGGRNWFMSWVRVDAKGRFFIYREWPTPNGYIEGIGLPGPWAEPDGQKVDGRRGLAQQPFGFGLSRYKEEIFKLEGWPNGEAIFERFMDSRYGNSPTVARESATTLIEECEEIGLTFRPTPGDNIDEGIDLINTMLDYDTTEPISALNEPKLYVTENCENTIYALHEWTGQDGKHGACKDPIDVIRYMCLAGLDYVDDEALLCRGGGSY